MFIHFIRLTIKGLIYRPIRSWLTVIGIVIGIMVVVIILSISAGIQSAVTKTLQMFGSDSIIVMPGEETNPILGILGGQKFKEQDLMALEQINGVRFVVPMGYGMVNVEYKGEKKTIMLHAANWENYVKVLELSQGVKLENGRWPRDDTAKEVVSGYRAAKSLFKNPITVSDELIIKSKRFTIVGSISEIGEQMADNVFFVSMDIFRELTGSKMGAASAFIKIQPDADMNLLAKQIKFQLSKQEVVRDFSVLTPDKAGRLVGNVLAIIELILTIFGLVSLIVGAVGIMNTMYTSVVERTKQIGIMKAVGASNESIMTLFLIESGLIGLVGGIAGIVSGVGAAYLIGVVAATKGIHGIFSWAALDITGFIAILFITFIVGIIAGLLPARQAARMEPAEALRYE